MTVTRSNAAPLTPKELAARWQRSTRWVLERLRGGELRGIKIGARSWRISVAEVERVERVGLA
jgi:hypothetical protein